MLFAIHSIQAKIGILPEDEIREVHEDAEYLENRL